MRDLALETDITMIIVTHEMAFAREIADRIVYMDEGRIVEDDRPEVILSKPNHERTRKFLQSVISG